MYIYIHVCVCVCVCTYNIYIYIYALFAGACATAESIGVTQSIPTSSSHLRSQKTMSSRPTQFASKTGVGTTGRFLCSNSVLTTVSISVRFSARYLFPARGILPSRCL